MHSVRIIFYNEWTLWRTVSVCVSLHASVSKQNKKLLSWAGLRKGSSLQGEDMQTNGCWQSNRQGKTVRTKSWFPGLSLSTPELPKHYIERTCGDRLGSWFEEVVESAKLINWQITKKCCELSHGSWPSYYTSQTLDCRLESCKYYWTCAPLSRSIVQKIKLLFYFCYQAVQRMVW